MPNGGYTSHKQCPSHDVDRSTEKLGRRKQATLFSFFLFVWLINSLRAAIAGTLSPSQMVNRSSTPRRTSVLHSAARTAGPIASSSASLTGRCTMQRAQSAVQRARFRSSPAPSRRVASRFSAMLVSRLSVQLPKDIPLTKE